MQHMSITTIIAVLFLSACQGKSEPEAIEIEYTCQSVPVQNQFTRPQLLQRFDVSILQGLASADVPDAEGAMGRNKRGYFHVRFQTGVLAQSDYAVAHQDTEALEHTVKALEYAFARQLPDGNFELVIPANLSGKTPNPGDLASGVSFFLSSAGVALLNLNQSEWYHSVANATYQRRIEALRPKIAQAANWLLSQKGILEQADRHAPNRLFFNALAFYSLGMSLEDEHLTAAGVSFATLGMSSRQPAGYFLEGNGWDSSYQGVALNVGFNLYSILPDNIELKTDLWNCLSCAAGWQGNRIRATGEISTEGNVRVYPGGESFLGQEKQVDWIKSMAAMFAMGYYSGQNEYVSAAASIRNYYNQ